MSGVAPDQHLVITRHDNRVLEIMLNRPKQLNALSVEMLEEMTVYMQQALDDDTIQGVLLTAVEGRAFCAGGDVKQIAANKKATKENGGAPSSEGCDMRRYITTEYILDSLVHHVGRVKPVVAIADGIVMGGGAGIFQGASHRVVTERSLFAMPECAIALLPDAGAMFFLTKAPGEIPVYCAMTGARLDGPDMIHSNLADHYLQSCQVATVLESLRSKDINLGLKDLETASQSNQMPTPKIATLAPEIDRIFSLPTVQEIHESLTAEKDGSPWAAAALKALEKECPVSHVLALHALRVARAAEAWDIDKGLAIEFIANSWLGYQPDFVEGVECAIGTKKGSLPAWTHHNDKWVGVANDASIQAVRARMDGKASLREVLK